MILDGGYLSEMDSPSALLAKEGGMFRSLWERHQRSHGIHATCSKDDLTTMVEVVEGEEGRVEG